MISHAIEDNNVLRFHIDYFDSAAGSDTSAPSWKTAVVAKILKDHHRSTVRCQFNAILTTASIKDAIEYYGLFAEAQKNAEGKLNIACIFSPPPSIKLDMQEDLDTEKAEYAQDSAAQNAKKEALERIISDYNAAYGKSFTLESADNTNNFIGYYGDIADRMKAHRQIREEQGPPLAIDLLIVVDMFLTGFDSKFINTMYIDKNLEYHGLIQAFSRTNRTYNALKDQGNIICFRSLKQKVDEAVKLFSSPEHQEAESYWETKSARELANDFAAQTEALKHLFAEENLDFTPASVANLEHKEEFYSAFQNLVRLKNTAEQYTFDDLSGLGSIFPEDAYKAFHRAFIESKKSPFSPETPDSPTPPPPEEVHLELFHTDIIDKNYIDNLIIDSIISGSIKIEAEKAKLFEMLFGDLANFEYSGRVCQFAQDYTFKGQTKEEIYADLRRYTEEASGKAWQSFANYHKLSLAPLLRLREEYLKCGEMREHMYSILEESFADRKLGFIENIKCSKELQPKVLPLLQKDYEEQQSLLQATQNRAYAGSTHKGAPHA